MGSDVKAIRGLERPQARATARGSARCWTHALRTRLIEHLSGQRYCSELDRDDFGLLRRSWHVNAQLAAEIVALARVGRENLEIIAWVIETGRSLDDAIAILERLDINRQRRGPS